VHARSETVETLEHESRETFLQRRRGRPLDQKVDMPTAQAYVTLRPGVHLLILAIVESAQNDQFSLLSCARLPHREGRAVFRFE
jgi:hypothetical protein